MCEFVLSWMGCWGHQNLKPTLTYGNWLDPYRAGMKQNMWQSMVVQIIVAACLSPWAYRLKKKLTKSVRKMAKKAKALARAYKDSNGAKRVYKT